MEDGKVTELEIDGKKIDEADYDKYEDIIAQSKPKSSTKGNAQMFFSLVTESHSLLSLT